MVLTTMNTVRMVADILMLWHYTKTTNWKLLSISDLASHADLVPMRFTTGIKFSVIYSFSVRVVLD